VTPALGRKGAGADTGESKTQTIRNSAKKGELTRNAAVASAPFTVSSGNDLSELLLAPRGALAEAADCPTEPASNVPIDDGEVFAGSNCNLNTDGDVDSFVFQANSGDIYHIVAALGGSVTRNICLTLFDPNFQSIFNNLHQCCLL
jgi:hypothetical protein